MAGNSVRSIAESLNIPKSTVHDIIKLYERKGTCTHRKRLDRLRLIGHSTEQKMIEVCKQNCETTVMDIFKNE